MKKILLLTMLMASFQVVVAQKKAPLKKTQVKSLTEITYEIDRVKNLANGQIDELPCRVIKRGNIIIWTSPDNTLTFDITKTEWKGKEHVKYTAHDGKVNAYWVFRTVNGEKQIAIFTWNTQSDISWQMHVADMESRTL